MVPQWCNPTGNCSRSTTMTFYLLNAFNAGFINSPLTTSIAIQTNNLINSQTVPIDIIPISISYQPIQTLTPGTLVTIAFSKNASLNVVGEQAQWNVSFTTITAIPAGGLILITFPVKAIYS